MQYFDSLAFIALAAAIHASFQLSVSMLTLMSGHSLSKKSSHGTLLRLAGGFVLGAMLMIALLLCFCAVILQNTLNPIPSILYAAAGGLCVGVGVAVWLFYYRHRRSGTILWIPRPIASFLEKRAKQTSYAAESFSLGMSSVIGELVFSCAPLIVASLILIPLPAPWQLGGIALYTIIASAPLGIIYLLIGGGHSLAKIQRWREMNKRFLQFTAGSALVILGSYVYIGAIYGSGGSI